MPKTAVTGVKYKIHHYPKVNCIPGPAIARAYPKKEEKESQFSEEDAWAVDDFVDRNLDLEDSSCLI